MGRLIEVQTGQGLPPRLVVRSGDLLVFEASGGHLRSGTESVELLGAFVKGVVGDNLQLLAPLGAPNAVVFFARNPGTAEVDVVVGDPWRSPKTLACRIVVE